MRLSWLQTLSGAGLLALHAGSAASGAASPPPKAPSQEQGEAAATAHYLANAGVLIVAGDTRVAHFEPHAEHWRGRHTHMAFPPYWFLLGAEGREILSRRIGADRVVGVHVPVSVAARPGDWPPELQGEDLFGAPGETREIHAPLPPPRR